jgi:hypothetical protein
LGREGGASEQPGKQQGKQWFGRTKGHTNN